MTRSERRLERDTPLSEANGLTLRELRADIAAKGHDVDPTLTPAETFALRNRLRAA